MLQEINIRNKKIGRNRPIFITAEIGITCNYDMNISKELIDAAASSGADAVKFIFWFPEEIMSDKTILYSYQTTSGLETENMFEMLQKLRFTIDQWMELKDYADQKNIIMFSTVNSLSGIKYAETIGLEAYKLSSWDFNYLPLWHSIARFGKPMIIDTGPVNTMELAKVMNIIREEGNEKCVLIHCTHTDIPGEMNMRSVPYLRKVFNVLTGYSSRGCESETDIMAVCFGAVYIEKRLTVSRDLPGHHHILSLEPKEFEIYVKMIRDVHDALGVEDLRPSPGDLSERNRWFRHIIANRDLPAGTILTEDMLGCKRPEKGISPENIHFFSGRILKRDLKYNEAINWSDV